VSGVELADGTRLPAQLVVAGIGAVPRIELARAAGLELDDGWIKVDAELRTSDPSIYAAGDVTSAENPRYGRRIHVEHWDNAKRQGKAAAANMLGAGEAYDRVPYFYSDQFDLGMEFRGFAPTWDRVVIRGDVAAREFHAFWLTDGRAVAAMNVNLWDDGERLQEIVESGERLDPLRLADSEVPLATAA
jgi:3-phenylpropionate/trans-cinnamate dioxygenase ferredoxin reductase subunit